MKRIKLNKIKLGLSLFGIIGATVIVAPILVSCGDNSKPTNPEPPVDPEKPFQSPDVNEAIFGNEQPTVQKLKEFFTKPTELVKADQEIGALIESATNIQVDKVALKNEYFVEDSIYFEARLCLEFFNKELKGTNYEINNKGKLINKEGNYIVYNSINFKVNKLSIADQEYIKQKSNWKDQPTNMTDREYMFNGEIERMTNQSNINYISYSDWTSSRMGDLKIINNKMVTAYITLKNNNDIGKSIYITKEGALGIFIINQEWFNKINNKMLDFHKEVLGINNFDKPDSEWTQEQKEKHEIIMNEIKEGQTSGIDFKFLKSKPLNITNRENKELITKITIIKPETIVEDIKNKTIKEKLKLFDIVYSDNQEIWYNIFGEAIKDINVSKVDDVFKIEIEYIEFLTNQGIVFPSSNIILPDGLELYSCLMSPWYIPKTIYSI